MEKYKDAILDLVSEVSDLKEVGQCERSNRAFFTVNIACSLHAVYR